MTPPLSLMYAVGRLLLMTKDHHAEGPADEPNSPGNRTFHRCPSVDVIQDAGQKPFMPTTMRISQFANNKSPKEGDTVVYIDGGFDLYHPGHVALLEKAKVHIPTLTMITCSSLEKAKADRTAQHMLTAISVENGGLLVCGLAP